MTIWHTVVLASIICVGFKVAGYLVPQRLLASPTTSRITDLLTVALLAALIVVQTLADGQRIVADARVPAVIVAAALYALRVPFVVVVAVAALVAAGIRAFT